MPAIVGIISLSYTQALDCTRGCTRHLLLGNGFSMAAHPRFGYRDLADVAVSLNPALAAVFERHGTTNFEVALEAATDPLELRALRAGLVKAIAKVHPYRIDSLRDDEYEFCGKFLEQFVGVVRDVHRGSVFTTNYDLLLYWTLVKQADRLDCQDGFFDGGLWQPVARAQSRVFYLHGALHLYREAIRPKYIEERKLLWRPSFTLIRQVRNRLAEGRYPIFVTEGNPGKKLHRLRQSKYLRMIRRTYNAACREDESALFIIGHGLGPEDAHITGLIGSGRIHSVHVGWFTEWDRERLHVVAHEWQDVRTACGLPPLSVYAFKTKECPIWKPAEV